MAPAYSALPGSSLKRWRNSSPELRRAAGGRRGKGRGATGREAAGTGKPRGTRRELARRHDALSSSERPTSTRVRDTLPPPLLPRALAPHSLARHHVRGRQRLPGRFRLGCLGESQASSREAHALKPRPRTKPRPLPALLLGRPPPAFGAELGQRKVISGSWAAVAAPRVTYLARPSRASRPRFALPHRPGTGSLLPC